LVLKNACFVSYLPKLKCWSIYLGYINIYCKCQRNQRKFQSQSLQDFSDQVKLRCSITFLPPCMVWSLLWSRTSSEKSELTSILSSKVSFHKIKWLKLWMVAFAAQFEVIYQSSSRDCSWLKRELSTESSSKQREWLIQHQSLKLSLLTKQFVSWQHWMVS